MDEKILTAAHAQGQAVAVELAGHVVDDPRRLTAAWRKGHGAALKYLREAAGLSLERLAEQARTPRYPCTRSLVDQWEQGRSYPSPDHALALAQVYGVPYARLRMLGIPTVGETRDPVAARDPWAVK